MPTRRSPSRLHRTRSTTTRPPGCWTGIRSTCWTLIPGRDAQEWARAPAAPPRTAHAQASVSARGGLVHRPHLPEVGLARRLLLSQAGLAHRLHLSQAGLAVGSVGSV